MIELFTKINNARDECPKLQIHAFFISNTFISNARLKLAKTKQKTKAKQHPEAELSLFENYSLCLSTSSSIKNRRHS